jgi:O-antigen/teichoic acid export membrane protein
MILSFGVFLCVFYVFNAIILNSNAVVIAAFLPIEAVTSYAIAGSLCVYAKEIPKSLSGMMAPRVSALTAIGSTRVGDDILLVGKIATLACTSVAVTFLFRGESFITLWMGAKYGPASGEVLRILAIVTWLEASRSVVVNSLIGMGRLRMLIPGIAIEAACNLVLSVALVGPLGITGVALGTMIPSVLFSIGYLPRRLSIVAGVPVGLFQRNAVLMPTLACLPFAVASVVIERFVPATNLAVFFMQVLLILPLVPVTGWFLCLTTTEKEHARSELRKITERYGA